MTHEGFRTGVPQLARGCSRLVQHLRRGIVEATSQAPGARGFITPEDFQEELITLGLSGKEFVVEDYVSALSNFLEISVSVHVIPDRRSPELARQLALSGRLGEIRYSGELGLAAVLVPESLPPLVSDLTVLHEVGHLAGGDLMIEHLPDDAVEYDATQCTGQLPTATVRPGKRLARGLPFSSEAAREREANLRASYAFVAGCLGEESPYVHGMYQVL
jgi:hypothetical protein